MAIREQLKVATTDPTTTATFLEAEDYAKALADELKALGFKEGEPADDLEHPTDFLNTAVDRHCQTYSLHIMGNTTKTLDEYPRRHAAFAGNVLNISIHRDQTTGKTNIKLSDGFGRVPYGDSKINHSDNSGREFGWTSKEVVEKIIGDWVLNNGSPKLVRALAPPPPTPQPHLRLSGT